MREFLRRNPLVGSVAGIALIAGAAGYGIFRPSGGPDIPTKAWFTNDDGKSLFAADKNLVPPFDHQGQPAVKAVVYRCQRHDKQFTNHLERYTPEAQAAFQRTQASGEPVSASVANGRQVKKPGSGDWVMENDMSKAMAIIIPRCPEGDNDMLEGVQP